MTRSSFVSIDSSIFDHRFCLDPYPYLEPLYKDPAIAGFHSEGMNFCIRFEDCRALIEEDIETDSSWLTERIITRLPFEVP